MLNLQISPLSSLGPAGLALRLGFDMTFECPAPTPMVLMLFVHPDVGHELRMPEQLQFEPHVPLEIFRDCFGNVCGRLVAPSGLLRICHETVFDTVRQPEPSPAPEAKQHRPDELPPDTLHYLLGSRYCEVDRLSAVAWDLFGRIPAGGARALAVNDWVFQHVTFGYRFSRPNKTALDVYTERTGVCRDMMHLAVTFCRALGIPARYATGYLPDIDCAPDPTPMDFSAFYEVYLDGRWWPLDARHGKPRTGRVLIARGRDAADVALVTSFGRHTLRKFVVVTEELAPQSPLRPHVPLAMSA